MSLDLTAAPSGARVGFTAAADGTHQVVLTVAPKAWRAGPRRHLHVDGWTDATHHALTLFEADRLYVTAPDRGIETLLNACLDNAQDPTSDAGWSSALLAPAVRPQPSILSQATPPDNSPHTPTDLLLLFDRLDLLHTTTDDLRGQAHHSPLHRPLLYRRFLDEVAAHIHTARRGYRAVTATRTTIRGRVDAGSIARHLRTGDPELLCRYDELTESTQLLGIICTALQAIAERSVPSPFTDRFAPHLLRRDAVTLRRMLAEVTALSATNALAVGPRLHLNRLDRPWQKALALALTVISEREHTAHQRGPRYTDAIELSIPTDKLWERVVTEVLIRGTFATVLPQRAQPPHLVVDPWLLPTAAHNTHPDNIVVHDNHLWVVDAKYKAYPSGALPGRDDQYQMFAYSHLVGGPDRPTRRIMLIYPGNKAAQSWPRGRDPNAQPVLLTTATVPFPSAADARTPAAWNQYLDRAATHLTQEVL